MPVRKGKDYYQWGTHGKKYYYVIGDPQSRQLAKLRAIKQGQAILISEHLNSKRFQK